MQTFVPSDNVAECARVMDQARLGKQRVETLQVVRAICLPEYGWQSHPAVGMWRGHVGALVEFQRATVREWRGVRGFKDTCWEKTLAAVGSLDDERALAVGARLEESGWPVWWGSSEVHASHRSMLLAKDPEWYGRWGWSEEPGLGYVWPECGCGRCTG